MKGIKIDGLSVYKRSLFINYKKFLRNANYVKSSKRYIDDNNPDDNSTIKRLVDPKTKYFEQNKIKINKEFAKQLGIALARFYEISGSKKDKFKVSLEKGNIRIDF